MRKTQKNTMGGVLHTARYELSHTDLPLKGKRHTESRHDVYKSSEINSLKNNFIYTSFFPKEL